MALDTVSDLIKAFRADEKDDVAPYFWSDAQLVRFTNQALTEFCELTLSVYDDSSAITAVDFSVGEQELAYPEAIIDVVDATLLITGRSHNLDVVPPGHILRANLPTSGRPRLLIVNSSAGKMKLAAAPTEAGQLLLTVIRRPLKELVLGDRIADVPAHNRHILLTGIKHYAYGVADSERFDPAKSANFNAEFAAECQRIREDGLLRRASASKPIRPRW